MLKNLSSHYITTFRSNGEKNPRVKHYQIRQTETGEKFYLAEKYLFGTIPELINYHQHNAAGNDPDLLLQQNQKLMTSSADKTAKCFSNTET